MNQLAVVHQGRGIDCFALDAHTFRIRLRCAAGDFDRVELCYALNKYEDVAFIAKEAGLLEPVGAK